MNTISKIRKDRFCQYRHALTRWLVPVFMVVWSVTETPAQNLETHVQDTELPWLLFVPGYTDCPLSDEFGNRDNVKEQYYQSQREDFAAERVVVYMNDEPGYDSNREAIQLNANAIARVISNLWAGGTRVTIISHSKGGQEVLHALVDVDRSLWPAVAGWVAFTSNFFESEFPITIDANDECGAAPDCPPARIPDRGGCPPPDDQPSRYTDYHVDADGPFRCRQLYMRARRDVIKQLTDCVATICAYATYIPRRANPDANPPDPGNTGLLNANNEAIRQAGRGPNDGAVPARAGKLPGAILVRLPDDPALDKCGVDHLAPALEKPAAPGLRFWTAAFRNAKTREYINFVEHSVGASAGADQIVECGGAGGTCVVLDGSASVSICKDIVAYDWLVDGQLVAEGRQPTACFPVGQTTVELRVTDCCGAVDTDEVVVTVVDTSPPEILINALPRLWPPNHKLRLSVRMAAVDICDENPFLTATVTSNEPINGPGDGNTAADWQVVKAADGTVDVWLRAERRGRGTGRIYQVTAFAIDASGNSATATRIVTVEHDRRR